MVTAIMIVEVLGRPADHARSAIEKYMKRLDDIKSVKVIKKDFGDPKLVDDKNQMYTCFCEVEFSCESLSQLVDIIFDFMPSSVEVVDPARVTLESNEATSLLNAISGRLHRYDDVVKVVQNREKSMMQQIQIAKKLLKDNNLIDDEGKILVEINQVKSEKEDKKEDKD